MNVTDVGHLQSDADEGEDKLEVKARLESVSPWEIARKYEKEFFRNIGEFNIRPPSVIARATDHIPEMVKLIIDLENNGFTYNTDVGVIFDTSKFAKYPDFARLVLKDQMAGARVNIDAQRKNPWDFALWVVNKPNHIMKWNSPWGVGYPGWHIECSAICIKYLGNQIDIHTGGEDHIPIHHTNEIAQTESYTGKKMASIWVHTSFLKVDGVKMSKSLNNLYTLDDLRSKGFSPLALRYMLLNSDYHKSFDFTWAALYNSQNELIKLWTFFASQPQTQEGKILDKYMQKFKAILDDGQNTPSAISVLWELINSKEDVKDIVITALEFDKVFALDFINAAYHMMNLEILQGMKAEDKQTANLLLAKREKARREKRYGAADQLRKEIEDLGFVINDGIHGSTLMLKSYGIL